MAIGLPVKANYAAGDILTATNMNDLSGTFNQVATSYGNAAGKNKIINGDFFVNQRGFTSTTATSTFTFDRWQTNVADGTVTISAQTFTPGSAPVSGYEGKNYLRCVTTGQTLTTARANISQGIENVRTFAGQIVTFSFWAKAGTGTPEIGIQLQQNFGSGSPSAAVNTTSKVTISTSWARYSVTLNVPSIAGKTLGTSEDSVLRAQFWFSAGSSFAALSGGIGLQNNTFDIWGVQLEAGSIATPFQTATGTIQGELAACQRYYTRFNAGGSASFLASGNARSTTIAGIEFPFQVRMRITPSTLDYSGINIADKVAGFVTSAASLVAATSTPDIAEVEFTTSGLTQYRMYFAQVSGTSSYVGFSAEL